MNLSQVIISSPRNTSALRNLYDQVEAHVQSMRSLGDAADTCTYGNHLLPLLTKKLPSELQLEISCHVKEEDWTLDNLMCALESELKAREKVSTSTTT